MVDQLRLAETQAFREVFLQNRWGDDESLSGAGSALSSKSVKHAIEALEHAIRSLNIRVISDAPCGDFNWIPLILGKFPFIEYRGYDLVPDLIERNKTLYPDRLFRHLDLATDIVSESDLVICKDLFLHVSFKTISLVLKNFKLSGSRYLLASSETIDCNIELLSDELGDFRKIDLEIEPFSMPPPMARHGYMALWDLSKIEQSVFDDMVDAVG